MLSKWIETIFFVFFLANVLPAAVAPQRQKSFDSALKLFQSGDYVAAADGFESLSEQEQESLEPVYWLGVSAYKLQEFEKATKWLQKVAKKDKQIQFPEAPYYLGQSRYALKQYRLAIGAFEQSIRNEVERAPSIFYKGYLHVLLEEPIPAIETFLRLASLEDATPYWRQVAYFNLGEVYYAQASNAQDLELRRELVLKEVIPAYESSIQKNPSGELTPQARIRIANAYALIGQAGPETLGRIPISSKPWMVMINQEVKYDTNILGEGDEKEVKAENAGAGFATLSVFGRYESVFRRRVVMSFELALDTSYHFRQDVPEVFGNDSINATPAVRLRYDHLVFGRSASALLEYEYTHGRRDFAQRRAQPLAGETHNVIVGENLELFSWGTSSFTANLSHNESKIFSGLTSVNPGVSLSQAILFSDAFSMNVSLNFEKQMANLSFFDQQALNISLSASVANIGWETSLDLILSTAITDTMNQQDTRGTEYTVIPIAMLTKYLDSGYRYSLSTSYMFMRNYSRAKQDYQFAKHIVGLGLRAVF